MNRFEDQVAVVTGASRGIGLAIATRLVSEGARVCITARKPEGLAAAIETLEKIGEGRVISVAGRADDAEHQQEVLERTVSTFGRLDVLVNNTGINPTYGTLMEIDDGSARKIMDVNVLAALNWIRRAREHGLGADRPGAVVNVASIAGLHPSPGIAYYGVSKSAVIGLTMQLGAELGPQIRVNAVAPAVVKTKFAAALYEENEAEVVASYVLGRLGDPADVAAAVAFFASSDASWITGQTLLIDGGVSLRSGLG
jgi:NAD(P)-dependent dehydrogenase (short-subunit alcohol dehydrogenase family)